jgi:membrane carboxypeptidase/penicillin-binding protein
VTLDAMTAAFAAFANGGLVSRPYVIRRVLDRDGAVLFEVNELARRAIAPENAYRMADMLADVVDFGTGSAARRLGFDRPAAGKTGTTNDYRDAWFIGFTPALVAGVWVGYDQPRTIRANGYASALAVPLWTQFMKTATRGDRPRWFAAPRGLGDHEGLRGVVLADGDERPQKKRGFWARLFGLGDERRRGDDRRDNIVIVDDDERDERDRHGRERAKKDRKRDKDREREERDRP